MAFDITLRDPGASFNINLADTIAFLIGAYWGIKITVTP